MMEQRQVIDLDDDEDEENARASPAVSHERNAVHSETKLEAQGDALGDFESLEFTEENRLDSIMCTMLSRGVTTPSSKKTASDHHTIDSTSKTQSRRTLTQTSIRSNDSKVLKLSGSSFRATPKKSDLIRGVVSQGKASRNVMGIEKCVDVASKPKVTRGLLTDTQGIDKIPFWISKPKDAAEVPGYIKSVATRLAYVEGQLRKFNAERQNLLSCVWRLKEEEQLQLQGNGNSYPRPMIKQHKVAKTIASDDEAESILAAKINIENDTESNTGAIPSTVDAEPSTPSEKNIKGKPPVHAEPHNCENMGQNENVLGYTSNDFRNFTLPQYEASDSCSASYNLKSDVSADEFLHSNEPVEEELSDESFDSLDPLDFFKHLEFKNLDHQSIVTWLEFFGVKLEKIRRELSPYLDAI